MSLRVGIDMDQVLFDIDSIWTRYINDHREEHGHKHVFFGATTWDSYEETCQTCFRDCCQSADLLRQGQLYSGAREVLEGLKRDGCSFHLITHRPAQLEMEIRRLLKSHQVADVFETITVTTGAKSLRCRCLGLEFMLDDSPKVVFDLIENSQTLPIVFDRPWNRLVMVPRVHSWAEFAGVMRDGLEML